MNSFYNMSFKKTLKLHSHLPVVKELSDFLQYMQAQKLLYISFTY